MRSLLVTLSIATASFTAVSFAQAQTKKPTSIDNILDGLDEQIEAERARAPKESVLEAGLRKMREADAAKAASEKRAKELAAKRDAERASLATQEIGNLASKANLKAQMRSTCSEKNHIVPDMRFANPVTAPAGTAWPEGVDSFTAAGFTDVRAMTVDLSSIARDSQFPKPTHEMIVTTVVANGEGWKASELIQTLARASGLFAKCGIQVRLNVVTGSFPYNLTSIDENKGRYVVAKTPVKTRPVLYFVRDTSGEFRANGGGHAFALTTGVKNVVNSKKGTGFGTAFFGRDTAVDQNGNKRDYQAVEDDRYVIPIAHELGHLLGDTDHVSPTDPPNILQGVTNRLSSDITPQQCETFRANKDYVKPLLE
jgi:hypothetical protein